MTALITSSVIEILIAAVLVIGYIYERKFIEAEDRLFALLKRKFTKTHTVSPLAQKYEEEKNNRKKLADEYALLLADYDKPHLKVLHGNKTSRPNAEVA